MISRRFYYIFAFLRPLFRAYNRHAFRCQPAPDPGLATGQPAIVLSNHIGNFDPFLLATSFRQPVFFVASDHIFRLGLISRLIKFLVAPIPIVKSHIDLRTIRTISGIIKDGGIIGLFPEGNRNFNGLTGTIPVSTGKLVRQLKATLLIYRLRGGYMTTPRWARYRREGIIQVELARRVDPDELAAMTADEITRLIQDSINVDAFADQNVKPVHYPGKKLAEYLERVLFVCPRCLGLDTLRSNDDHFRCSCGFDVKTNDLGFFEPADEWSKERASAGQLMDTVGAWDLWQRQAVADMISSGKHIDMTGQTPIFTDHGEVLAICQRAYRNTRLGKGTLSMYADRLEFEGLQAGLKVYPIDMLDRVTLHGPQVLQFSVTGGDVYECRSRKARSAFKYMIVYFELIRHLKGDAHGFFGF